MASPVVFRGPANTPAAPLCGYCKQVASPVCFRGPGRRYSEHVVPTEQKGTLLARDIMRELKIEEQFCLLFCMVVRMVSHTEGGTEGFRA